MKKRVVSIGDLVIDYYYKNGKLLGVNGGITSHNIIANLSKMKVDTAVFGVCGDDSAGEIAIKSLEDLNVDVSNIIKIKNVLTRCFHVSYTENNNKLSFVSKKRCLFCNNKRWYDDSLINVQYVLNNICKEDILVFDNLNSINQEIIKNTNNLKLIDLGQYFEFEKVKDDEIIDMIKNKFVIINFNERVSKYFISRFKLKSELDLYNLLSPKLITITKGKKGASFIYNNKIHNFKLESASVEIDATGAGDAFFSSIIKDWINNDLNFDEDSFFTWYKNSCKLTSKVVKNMGARGHLRKLYKIKGKENCTCQSFELVNRKQIKRCNININNLEARIIKAINSNAVKKLENIDFNENENYLFIGTGGSFAPAKFSSVIINEMYGSNTYAMYPRDILYRNNSKIDRVILYSYSGTTNDLLECIKNFEFKNIFMMTKGDCKKIALKTGISKNNIISYRTDSNKGKERGFLSFEGALVPAAIFLQFYFDKNENHFNIETFIKDSIQYWNQYLDKYFNDKNIKEMFKKDNIINIFTGDYTQSACLDLESKIVESGIFNCMIHEKKNFSHGRFVNYENLHNKQNIYLKQKVTSDYENVLLDYIKNDTTLFLESRYNGILCEFDLLIASQFLIYYIGKKLDIDVSKPKYSEKAMKIYFYKGQL